MPFWLKSVCKKDGIVICLLHHQVRALRVLPRRLYIAVQRGIGYLTQTSIHDTFIRGLFPRATSQATACSHFATAARVKYPRCSAALQV